MVKNPLASAGGVSGEGRSLSQEDPLEEGWLPTPVLMPGSSHGRRSLAGYSPRGHRDGRD